MKESLILGVTSGAAIGAVAGTNTNGDRDENAIKGAVLGGVFGAIASYFTHEALESRDEKVRRDTLMNLENYDVLGVPKIRRTSPQSPDRCRTTRKVDGKLVSIRCDLAGDQGSVD